MFLAAYGTDRTSLHSSEIGAFNPEVDPGREHSLIPTAIRQWPDPSRE
jgi:hypothetical protein